MIDSVQKRVLPTYPLLRLLSLGDVDVDASQAQGSACVIPEGLESPEQPVHASVGPHDTPFPLSGFSSLKSMIHETHGLGSILGVNHVLPCRLCFTKRACFQPVHGLQFRSPTVQACLHVPVEGADSRRLLRYPPPLLALIQFRYGECQLFVGLTQFVTGLAQFAVLEYGGFVGGKKEVDDLLSIGSYDIILSVEIELDSLRRSTGFRLRTVNLQVPDAGEQIFPIEGFGNEVVGAAFQRFYNVMRVGKGGQQN